jgi:hypothetical protein
MRVPIVVVFALTIAAMPTGVFAAEKMRLAQSSTVTNCMMICNTQAANCQSSCLVVGAPPTTAATITSNATANPNCLSNCSSVQLQCQNICAQSPPLR